MVQTGVEYIHGTKDFKLEGASAVTLGKFDGCLLYTSDAADE